jgi:hypothetical protein
MRKSKKNVSRFLGRHFFLKGSVAFDFFDESQCTSGRNDQDKNDPENSSIKVSIVIDGVLLIFPFEIRINQEKTTQDESGKADDSKKTNIR